MMLYFYKILKRIKFSIDSHSPIDFGTHLIPNFIFDLILLLIEALIAIAYEYCPRF